MYQRREEEDHRHHRHRPDKGRQQDGCKAADADGAYRKSTAQEQHHQGHTQSGPTIDTKHTRTSQGIAESRLQHQAADSQRRPAEHRRDGLRQARLEDDELPRGLLTLIAQKDAHHVARWNRYGSHQQVQGEQHHDKHAQSDAV